MEIESPLTNGVVYPRKVDKPRYCDKCLENNIEPNRFDLLDDLLAHYDTFHVAKHVSFFRENALQTKNEIIKTSSNDTVAPVQQNKVSLQVLTEKTNNLNLTTATTSKTIAESQPVQAVRKIAQKRRSTAVNPVQTSSKSNTLSVVNHEQVNKNTQNLVNTEEELIIKLETMKIEELKYFNLTMTDLNEYKTFYSEQIDESKLKDKLAIDNTEINKKKEIVKGKIVWAIWREKGKEYYWPSRVEKIEKKGQIKIKYFEYRSLTKYAFPKDYSKIELFFDPKHFEHKLNGIREAEDRFQFVLAYTTALNEITKLKDLNESLSTKEATKTTTTTLEMNRVETFLVNDKQLTLDQIKEYANNEKSEKQIKINNDREFKSEELMKKLRSKDCQEYIISILTTDKCEKNNQYLVADIKQRKLMEQQSPGPLIDQHQQEVHEIVSNLSKEYFKQKPVHLTNYEHDILYPEAVIWSIQKKFNLNKSRAEQKYLDGFKRTPEEIMKQKCNEFLIKRQLHQEDEQEIIRDDDAPTTSAAVANPVDDDRMSINENNVSIEDELPNL